MPSQSLTAPVEIFPVFGVYNYLLQEPFQDSRDQRDSLPPLKDPTRHFVSLALFIDLHPPRLRVSTLLLPKNVQERTSPEPFSHGCISCSVLLSGLHRTQLSMSSLLK